MGYRWYDFVSNQRFFHETDSRPIASIVRQRNCGYMGMWRDTQKPIQFIGSFPKVTWLGGGLGDAHRTLGCGKLMPPAGSYSVWEGSLHGDLQGVTVGSGTIG